MLALDIPWVGDDYLKMHLGGNWHDAYPPGEEYFYFQGITIIERETAEPIAWAIAFQRDGVPAVVVQGYGADASVGTAFARSTSSTNWWYLTPGLPQGRYLAVMTWGGSSWDENPLGPATWRTQLTSNGLDPSCENIATGALYTYDQRDFSGRQIMLPQYGISDQLTLDVVHPRSYSVGAVYAHVPPGGPLPDDGAWMTVTDGSATWNADNLIRPLGTRAHALHHTGEYFGPQPLLWHGGVTFDLPT